jgi:hypothetical protein
MNHVNLNFNFIRIHFKSLNDMPDSWVINPIGIAIKIYYLD